MLESRSFQRVAVLGCAGRMGKALLHAIYAEKDLKLAAAIERPESPTIGSDVGALTGVGGLNVKVTDALAEVISGVDVVIDFTRPDVTLENLIYCLAAKKAMVVGTTGFQPEQIDIIHQASKQIPIVMSPNMSIGISLCLMLIELATKTLGDSVDIEIIEAHHRHKVDAPSGTALQMGHVIAKAMGYDLNDIAVNSRDGNVGARPRHAIGFSSVRAGDIIGDHTVMFAGNGERIEITHRASDRNNFALGALRAARWLKNQSPGFYNLKDVLEG